jgi:hypothetical protein
MKLSIHKVLMLSLMLFTSVNGATMNSQISKIPELQALSMDNVLQKYGKPEKNYSFKMKEPMHEFRVELLNFYPQDQPENRDVEIRELWWKDGDYNITVWFHQIQGQWQVLDTRRWHKDIDF